MAMVVAVRPEVPTTAAYFILVSKVQTADNSNYSNRTGSRACLEIVLFKCCTYSNSQIFALLDCGWNKLCVTENRVFLLR